MQFSSQHAYHLLVRMIVLLEDTETVLIGASNGSCYKKLYCWRNARWRLRCYRRSLLELRRKPLQEQKSALLSSSIESLERLRERAIHLQKQADSLSPKAGEPLKRNLRKLRQRLRRRERRTFRLQLKRDPFLET